MAFTLKNDIPGSASFAVDLMAQLFPTSVVIDSTVNLKYHEVRVKSTATSGDNRLSYNRFDLDGAGASGDCFRILTDLGAAVDTARGAHISIQGNNSGYVSGLGVGVDGQLFINGGALGGGTWAVFNAEIYSSDANADTNALPVSYFRVVNGGNETGQGNVDDDAVLFDLTGFTSGAAHMWYDNQKAAPAVEEFVKVRTPAGIRYIGLYNANA